jgi:thermitase
MLRVHPLPALLAAAVSYSACASAPKVPVTGIAVHFEGGPERSGDTLLVRPTPQEPQSVGDAFDEAYQIREQRGAKRAEPLFRMQIPLPRAEISSLGDETHDPRAAADPLWSLKQVRAATAWEAVRTATGRPAGEEASGIFIAHPDTGYLPHAEITTPIAPDLGYDYVDEDDDPTDELLDEDTLDNPTHGTGSGSAIVSPEGCQVANLSTCPTGPALGARLVPLRVGRSVVIMDTDRLSRAILDASGDDRSHVKTETGVMSISMGGLPSWKLWDAVKKAEARGYLIVAAAGNHVRTVVWPARFPSVVAVAATNVGCLPWSGSSAGPAVDVSAPGESVWRASLDDGGADTTGMSKGTTYATATVAGIAALWLARHAGEPDFERLRAEGRTSQVFHALLAQTAWKPGSTGAPVRCDPGVSWDSSRYGAGIADAAALLAAPLPEFAPPSMLVRQSVDELPLWSSLYPEETSPAQPIEDYRRLFGLEEEDDLEEVAIFEAEVLHHYATSEGVRSAIDAIVMDGDRSDAAFARIRAALLRRDLSTRLRNAL